MRKHYCTAGLALALTCAAIGTASADTIAHWNFNAGAAGTAWPASIASDSGSGTWAHTWNPSVITDGGSDRFAGSTVNAVSPDVAGNSFCPLGSAGNGNTIVIAVPTTGYEDIQLTWAGRNTSTGYNSVAVEYSSDGTNFTSLTSVGSFTTSFALKSVDLSSITAVDNNANFKLRLTLTGASTTTGNMRFDNVQIVGTVAAGGDTTPPTVTSIARQTSSPTNAASSTWRVTFDEDINASTVNEADFTLIATAGSLGTAAVTGVSTVNATTFDVTASTGGAGDRTLRLDVLGVATIEDTTGNDITASFTSGESIVVDLSAPAVSTPAITAATDSGSSNSDAVTNNAQPEFAGTAESGAAVRLYSGAALLATGSATGGNYSLTPSSPLAEGSYSIHVEAEDSIGNVASSGNLAVIIDQSAPVSTASIAADAQVGGAITVTAAINDTYSTVVSADLLVRGEITGSGWSADSSILGGSQTFTPAIGDNYHVATSATDLAGNTEAAPSIGTFLGAGDDAIAYNPVENAPLTLQAPSGAPVLTFPMEDGLNVVIWMPNVAVGDTITVSRIEGDNAPAGVNAARLIDAYIAITAGGSLSFTSAVVTVDYDEALLGGLLESEIDHFYRDNSGTVTEGTVTVNATNNTIQFVTAAFSDWYFGNNDAEVNDWTILEK